jgi:hypothetical protein
MNSLFLQKCLLSDNVPNMIIYGKSLMNQRILSYYYDIMSIKHINEMTFNNFSYRSSLYHSEIDIKKINKENINHFYDLLKKKINHREYYTDKKYKTIIFYNCDAIKISIQNRLRVIIEKYRETTIFIFISHKINNIIVPIKSRCVLIRIPNETMYDKCKIIKNCPNDQTYKNKIYDYLTLFSSVKDKDAIISNLNEIKDFESHYHILSSQILHIINIELSSSCFKKLKEYAYFILKYNLHIPLLFKILLNEITNKIVLTNKIIFEIVKLFSDTDYQLIYSYKKIIVLEGFLLKLNDLLNSRY